MIKKISLALLLFSVVITVGCYPPETSLRDKLLKLDFDLQEAVFDIDFVIEEVEKVGCGNQLSYLMNELSVIQNDIAVVQNELYIITEEME